MRTRKTPPCPQQSVFCGDQAFETVIQADSDGVDLTTYIGEKSSKLLRELAAWSQSIGFAPHRDFVAVERIFGDVSADASDGKHVYLPGPTDTAPLIRRRIEQLRKSLGGDGFGFETAASPATHRVS
jgi:hypothetical protein